MSPATPLHSICQAHHAVLIEETAFVLRIAASKPPGRRLFMALEAVSDKKIEIEIWSDRRLAQWSEDDDAPDTAPAPPEALTRLTPPLPRRKH